MNHGPRSTSILPKDTGQTAPLSYAQQRVYFVHEWDPDAGSYVFPVNLRLRGPLDRPALERALVELVDRHSVLRSTITARNGGTPVQVVGANRFGLRFTDLCLRTNNDRTEVLRLAKQEQADQPFDLSTSVFRGHLLALADDDHVLLLTFHHIAFDGWSSSVLAAEMEAGYRRHTDPAGQAAPDPLPMQYIDFARQDRRDYGDAADALLVAYWRERLMPLPDRLQLPTSRARPEFLSGRTARIWRHLSTDLTDAVAGFARARRATPYMALMSAFQIVLAHHGGREDFCIGGATAGRATAESFPLIGMFVNEVVYRSDHTRGVSANDLLGRVRANALLAYKNDRLPFERLVELLAPQRSLGYHPLFQHAIVLQPAPQGHEGFKLPGLVVEAYEAPAEGSALDLSVSFHLDEGSLHMAVDFSTDLWDEDWPSSLADDLTNVLSSFAEHPDAPADAALVGRVHRAAPRRAAEENGADILQGESPDLEQPTGDLGTSALLSVLWAEALGLSTVSADDNFFDIGGDSLLALQIVAKAQAAGLNMRVRDLFRHQTIRSLTPVLVTAGPTGRAVERPEGDAPLLPVQEWFLSGGDAGIGQYNYTLLYRVAGKVDPARLSEAVQAALRQHDAFRLRFQEQANGSWNQTYTDAEGFEPLHHVDLSRLSGSEAEAALVREAERVQGLISLHEGPLVRTVHFAMAAGDDDRLLVVSHHLIMDPASARIVADDIATAVHQLGHGQPPDLLAPRCTYAQWGRALRYLALSEQLAEEIPYWLRVLSTPRLQLPVEAPAEENDVGSQRTLEFDLDAKVTRALRFGVVTSEDISVTELLLAALGSALTPWTEGADLLIDLETSGREDILDVDASRTVGWFTAMFPFALPTAPSADTSLVRRVRDEYRRLPRKGMGYGLLSRTADVVPTWDADLGFTYMGVFDVHEQAAEVLLTVTDLPPESDRHPRMRRRQEIEVGAAIVAGRLSVAITYSSRRWSQQAMENLGRAAVLFLEQAARPHLTP